MPQAERERGEHTLVQGKESGETWETEENSVQKAEAQLTRACDLNFQLHHEKESKDENVDYCYDYVFSTFRVICLC